MVFKKGGCIFMLINGIQGTVKGVFTKQSLCFKSVRVEKLLRSNKDENVIMMIRRKKTETLLRCE